MFAKDVIVKFTKRQFLDRWILVAYKIVNFRIKELAEGVHVKEDDRFYEVLNKYAKAYIEDDKMPPEAIAPTILNMVDDYMAGNEIKLKAGDYIAVQNFIRQQKSV